MSDERIYADSQGEESQGDGRSRLRIGLAAILVLLMILLAVLAVFIVRVLTPTGGPAGDEVSSGIEWVRSIYGYGPSQDQQFYRPTDVAVGPDGTIWGTDPQRARILGFNPDGSFDTLIHQGPAAGGPGRMRVPEGLTVSDDNEIYVADYGNNKVMVFSRENELLREWRVPLPLDVAVWEDRVAVATLNGVALFDGEGELLTLLGSRGDGEEEFDGPHGIEFVEDGTFYVSDTHNQRVKAYTPDGELLWTSVGGDVAEEGGSNFQVPSGLTVDGAGRIVLVDPFEFSLVVLDEEGVIEDRWGEFGQSDGRFAYPTGLDYDPARDWFVVADTTNDRLQIVRIDGSGGTPLSALTRLGSSPYRVCAIPLILLLIALVILALRRRSSRRANSGNAELSDA